MTEPMFPNPPEPSGPSAYDRSLGSSLFMREAQPVAGVGMAAAVLIGAATVLSAVDTWSDWHRYNVVDDHFARGLPPAYLDDLQRADDLAWLTGVIAFLGLVAAGVVFVIWLWRARQNAENLCEADHRRARGWVIGSWICPVVNLWFPFMVVDDVHRASRPDNPRDLADLRSVPGSAALRWWWGLYLATGIIDRIGAFSLRGDALTVDDFQTYAVMSTISTLTMAGAAVLIIRIMREVNEWQAPRWPS